MTPALCPTCGYSDPDAYSYVCPECGSSMIVEEEEDDTAE